MIINMGNPNESKDTGINKIIQQSVWVKAQ